MAYNVNFKKGISTSYAALETKDANTFYYTSDDAQLYLGEIKLSNASDLAAAITRLTAVEGKADTNATSIANQAAEIADIKTELGALTGGEGSGTITDMIDSAITEALGTLPEGKTVKDYVDETVAANKYDDTTVKADVNAVKDAIDVLNGEKTVEGSVAKQVADAVASIVSDAPEAYDTLKEIADWIAAHPEDTTAMNTQIATNKNDIAALKALVGELPEGEDSTTIIDYINSKVAGVKDWTEDIATAKSEAITEAGKKADKALADAKTYADGLAVNYATAAQGAKADTAVQSVTTDTTEGAKGSIMVDGVAVQVAGLGTAAYKNEGAFDVAGSATSAYNQAVEYVDTALTWGTIE